MKLFDILKQRGLFSNDIKARIKNKQITLNGEVIIFDLDLNIELENDKAKVFEVGDFIFNLIKSNEKFSNQLIIFGFDDLFDSNIKSDLTTILDQFIVIKTSKKETFLLKKNNE